MPISKSLEYRFAAELSLISGIIILGASILYLQHVTFFPDMRWMMGPQLLGHVFITNVVGIVSGTMVIIAGIMIYVQPVHIRKWGVMAWVFASISSWNRWFFHRWNIRNNRRIASSD